MILGMNGSYQFLHTFVRIRVFLYLGLIFSRVLRDCSQITIASGIFITTNGLYRIQYKYSHIATATTTLNPT